MNRVNTMSSGEELPCGDQSPRRLSQIFESLVDFHSKSAQVTSTNFSKLSSAGSSNKAQNNPTSNRLITSSSSTPNSPRLLSKRNNSIQSPSTAAFIANPSLLYDNTPSSWSHFSDLTEQINNYQQDFSEINWQERCLELQLELHRSRNQASRVRDLLKEKVSELERRLIEAEQRSEDAQRQVRKLIFLNFGFKLLVMEQKFCEWPSFEKNIPDTDTEKTLKKLENQVEEQKQLRFQDAKQVEAKAAKIKEWVTNKLRHLEEQNQQLREENIKYHQQIINLNHIVSQNSSTNSKHHIRASLNLNIHEASERHQKSESLESPGSRSLEPDINYYYKKKSSMEPQELTRDLACAIEDLTITPIKSQTTMSFDEEVTHDYAEIYTPSVEKTQHWLTETSFRPPTPPLHRFPSWEAKIYQVAKEGLVGGDGGNNSTKSDSATKQESISQVTSYCDINVPVYATVKGRASQIRSLPFGDSSDESSDGEENNVNTYATSTHNSSSTENSSASAGRSTSPLKSQKVSVHQSPVKIAHPESPNVKNREKCKDALEGNEIDSISSDYAIPPDAMSDSEQHSIVEPVMPAVLLRSSYVDSPMKKVEVSEKSGHLIKLSGKLKTWRKRWFVLKDGTLKYWKSQNDVHRKPQGQIQLDDKCRVSKEEGASIFEINTGKKNYYLTADSNASMDDWIKTIQNVQRRNATKLLLSRDDQKPTIQGWVTKVKNGHSKKCWCVLLGRMFLYFKAPGETSPIGEINMRDAKVDEVEHISDDSDEESRDDTMNQAKLTIAILPQHQGPSYLIFCNKQERDNWLYHLTVVSGGAKNSGTQYEQLIQKLMEVDGEETSVIWRHPVLLHTKDSLTSPLTSLETESLHGEAIKLFKSVQLFMSVAVSQPAIDYHVVLAQNALQVCLDNTKLQTELICILIKQTSPHSTQKLSTGVQQLLLCATQSLFTCDSSQQQGFTTQALNNTSPPTHQTSLLDCKTNPPTYSFVQGWQLLALAVSLFVPKNNRLLWYLKLHLARHSDSKTEMGKYAIYCERALGRSTINGDREAKPSRMEVLSILLKNPYHHSLPHAIPVHFANETYQVCGFDGSTTIEEFQITLTQEIGCRDASNGFTLFSDDPIEKDLEHYLDPQAKLCDVISKWETALREKGSGKFENSRVVQLTYKNRLYWKSSTKLETDKERLFLVYQTNSQIVQGRFPLSKELALELASLMAQIDFGDCTSEKLKASPIQALDRFYPYRYRDTLSSEAFKELQDCLTTKWLLLKGKSVVDCVRIYITCARKWQYFGATLFQAQPRHSDLAMTWLAVAEDALSVLELSSMAPLARYSYDNILTFGGHLDDFMLVVTSEDDRNTEKKILFSLSKPKILELTMLIADYMNALGHTLPGTPKTNTLTRNNSHRSLKSRVQYIGSQANDTLNSYNSLVLSSHGQPDILKSTPDHQKSKKI
uniref:CSON015304 protein n=1 Tax=Culicoides sonorensis TaxID=179676 RepID=A0A336LP84_CULSO